MYIKKIGNSEINTAIELIWDTFLRFDAPDYSPQGVEAFRQFIFDSDNTEALDLFGAFNDEGIIGVIAVSEDGHICCFFVEESNQRQGVGRALWEYIKENYSVKTFTVNSSPYAVPVYRRLGFVDTDTERISDGIRYTPMKYEHSED